MKVGAGGDTHHDISSTCTYITFSSFMRVLCLLEVNPQKAYAHLTSENALPFYYPSARIKVCFLYVSTNIIRRLK